MEDKHLGGIRSNMTLAYVLHSQKSSNKTSDRLSVSMLQHLLKGTKR
jgi:hypothetical protein